MNAASCVARRNKASGRRDGGSEKAVLVLEYAGRTERLRHHGSERQEHNRPYQVHALVASPLYQFGAPRSIQLALKLSF